MNKSIYHSLLGAGTLALIAMATPVDGSSYASDCDEKCPPKPVVYVAFEGHETDMDDRYVAIDRVPRLVGYGCRGAGGPLYANEEDHFPRTCKAIEAWR